MTDQMGRLSGITLPDGSKFLRRVPVAKEADADFIRSFDRRTLFYDVFHDAETEETVIIAPSLRTQRHLFRNLILKVDGIPIEEMTIDHLSPRTSQIRFRSPTPEPETLRVIHRFPPKLNAQVQINAANPRKFSEKNALVAISKNNKLEWIQDWLRYYVTQHRANAVVLIDNASDDYGLEDLRSAIGSVDGIDAFEVLSAPFPFGPKAVDRISTNSKFLHLSALHIAHRRFLRRANGVLSVDIDELVTRPGEQTIFEAVKTSEDGFLSLKGSWRYARRPQDPGALIRHRDHVLKRIGKDAHMQPKWCVDPTGPLADRYWRTHGIAGAKRNFDHPFHYLHCRQITTNWDYDRDFERDELFEPAPETEVLEQAFADRG